jgi:LIM-domain binding protein
MKALFDANNKIEILDLVVTSHNEYIPRNQLQALENVDQKQSPRASKNLNKRTQQKQPMQPNIVLPESMVNSWGVPMTVMRFLEVSFNRLGFRRIILTGSSIRLAHGNSLPHAIFVSIRIDSPAAFSPRSFVRFGHQHASAWLSPGAHEFGTPASSGPTYAQSQWVFAICFSLDFHSGFTGCPRFSPYRKFVSPQSGSEPSCRSSGSSRTAKPGWLRYKW